MSILEIQKALKAAGYDPGPLDNKEGPRTRAALVAYQQAHGLSTAPDQWDKTVAALRGTGGTTAASGGSVADEIRKQFPEFSWMIEVPELYNKLNEAITNKWPVEQTVQALHQTNWWKSRTDAEVNWFEQLATNPAEATRRLNNYDSISKYMSLSKDMGLSTSFEEAARQVGRVVRGEIAPDALNQELRNMAKGLYPQLTQQIDTGSTVESVFSNYRNIAANLLGVNPDTIQLTDPKWQAPLMVREKNGVVRLATTDEWQTILRTTPKYGYATSKQGSTEGFEIGDAIARSFGNVA